MEETFTMSNGEIVEFYSNLSRSGINIRLITKLDKDDLQLFKKEIKEERDVVAIYNS